MERELTELNFIHLHKYAARQAVSKTILTRSINMLKLNIVVRKVKRTDSEKDQECNTGEIEHCDTSESTSSYAQPAISKCTVKANLQHGSIKRMSSKKWQSPKNTPINLPPVQMASDNDLSMRENRDMSTQTETVRIEP